MESISDPELSDTGEYLAFEELVARFFEVEPRTAVHVEFGALSHPGGNPAEYLGSAAGGAAQARARAGRTSISQRCRDERLGRRPREPREEACGATIS